MAADSPPMIPRNTTKRALMSPCNGTCASLATFSDSTARSRNSATASAGMVTIGRSKSDKAALSILTGEQRREAGRRASQARARRSPPASAGAKSRTAPDDAPAGRDRINRFGVDGSRQRQSHRSGRLDADRVRAARRENELRNRRCAKPQERRQLRVADAIDRQNEKFVRTRRHCDRARLPETPQYRARPQQNSAPPTERSRDLDPRSTFTNSVAQQERKHGQPANYSCKII